MNCFVFFVLSIPYISPEWKMMPLKSEKFVTAVTCMDGRVQIPVISYLKEKYGADYVDVITEPGPNKILAESHDRVTVQSIMRRVEISVKKHGSRLIAVVGHYDCAGNPTGRETQTEHTRSAVETVKSWGFEAEVTGLWVDEKWMVSEI